jgi:hypothetical protein
MTRLRRIATAALVGVRPQNDGIDKIIYNGGDGSPAPRVVACGPNTGLAGPSDGCFTIGGSSEFGS